MLKEKKKKNVISTEGETLFRFEIKIGDLSCTMLRLNHNHMTQIKLKQVQQDNHFKKMFLNLTEVV